MVRHTFKILQQMLKDFTLVKKEPRRNAGKAFLDCPEKTDESSTIIFLMP